MSCANSSDSWSRSERLSFVYLIINFVDNYILSIWNINVIDTLIDVIPILALPHLILLLLAIIILSRRIIQDGRDIFTEAKSNLGEPK